MLVGVVLHVVVAFSLYFVGRTMSSPVASHHQPDMTPPLQFTAMHITGSPPQPRRLMPNQLVFGDLTDRSTFSATVVPATKTFAYAVLTAPEHHATRLRGISQTWGLDADIRFAASDADDGTFPFPVVQVSDGSTNRGNLATKTMLALKLLCNHDADFYVFSDDDTFLSVRNLESIVSEKYSSSHDLYLGYGLSHTEPPFIGGGGGIVFSNNTMSKFCSLFRSADFLEHGHESSNCHWKRHANFPGDVAVSWCMNELKVPATHLHGFYPLDIGFVLWPPYKVCHDLWWIPKHIHCPLRAPYRLISFHYMSPAAQREAFYWTNIFLKPKTAAP